MPWSLRWSIALRQTLDPGKGLSAFLSRVSIVGMALAIALLLAVQSVMNGFEREMRERILSLLPHVQATTAGDAAPLTALTEALLRDPDIASVRPFIVAEALLMRGQTVSAAQLTGLKRPALAPYESLLVPGIIDWHPESLVLGASMAERLNLSVGDRVTFILPEENQAAYRPLRLQLSAVLDSGTELDEILALVHVDALEALGAGASIRRGVAVQLEDVFAATQWRWEIAQMLPSYVRVTDWRATHGNLYTAIQLSRDLIGLILFIVIFVAAFNVVSSLMLVVTDRRKAVAMLMAMGGRRADITAVFFLQGGLIGFVGALAGVALGYLLAINAPDLAVMLEQWLGAPLLQTDVYPLAFVPVDVRWQDAVITAAIAIGLSVLAATLPALRAASLPVAETLAH
ncbi:MAG: addiction module toxin YoeB [Halieaceae bacterium]|nr:MAG: addiction module toxin YoeB [Halieaceae bacterium]